MEKHFVKFRSGMAGVNKTIPTADGMYKTLVYADWAGSGRSYLPIEARIQQQVMPLITNTEAEVNYTRTAMTHAYNTARKLIAEHINASGEDIIITASSGATMLIKRFQAMLGLTPKTNVTQSLPSNKKPVVFVTHMEHYSNHDSWIETDVTVEVINPDCTGLVDLGHLQELLHKYRKCPLKMASVTACSNLTGISPPYNSIAKIMHEGGGFIFVDFSCSAPYVDIDMHPPQENTHLDAIFFSSHKFLGGPGSCGVLAFNRKLYHQVKFLFRGESRENKPKHFEKYKTIKEIERLEYSGTPALLQTIRAAMCIRLKEEMGVDKILSRDKILLDMLWKKLEIIPNLHIMASQHRDRLPIISFYIDNLDSYIGARLLNDKFAIQCKASRAAPGSYGYSLLKECDQKSQGDQLNYNQQHSAQLGWMRVSLHPVMMDEEIKFIADSIIQLANRHREWSQDYLSDRYGNSKSQASINLDYQAQEAMTTMFTRSFVH